MEKIVFASNNKNKLKEMKVLFSNYELLSLEDIGFTEEIEETGTTFLANALIKAKTVYDYLYKKGTPMVVIADDSGLCVDALDGAPGVYSARYGSVDDRNATNEENRKKLLKKLEGVENRKAHFCTEIVLYASDDDVRYGEGKAYGEISYAESGDLTFGYDPIFYSYDLEEKFSEVTPEEKNSVSHRARAVFDLFNGGSVVHMMKLRPEYYNKVATGEKTIEVRLFDEKRQNLGNREYIAFENIENHNILVTEITELKQFCNFDDCIEYTGTKKVGFNGKTPEDTIRTYREIYSSEDEAKYGVLAITLKVVEQFDRD